MNKWEKIKLGDIANFSNGKKRPDEDGSIPIYGGNGILGFTSKSNIENETIIVGRVGAYCGSVYYENRPIWVSDNALHVKPKKNIDTKFLYYFLISTRLNQHASGSSHPLLTQSLLNSLKYNFCVKFNTQKAIAEVLSSLDDKINLLHRQNKTLENLAQTLFRQYFIEEANDEWEEILITDLFEVRDGTHDSPKQKESGKPLITTKHMSDNSLDIDNAYLISNEDFNKVNQRSKVEQYDILFSMIGTIGLIYLEQSKKIDYAIKNIGLFKTSQNKDYMCFTYLWLKSSLGYEFIHENRSGSTQEYISLTSLRNIIFKIPNKGNLDKFNKKIYNLFDKILQNTKQIKTLENLRDTLLPKLMSGEVRVKI